MMLQVSKTPFAVLRGQTMRSYPDGVVFAAAVFAGHWFVLLPTSACIDGHRPVHRRRLVYDHSTGLVEGYCMDILK